MNGPDLLIHTKIRTPFIRPSLVQRPLLQARIAEGLRGPLTLVIAPAGFGKTTLAAASLAGSGLPAAWLSLDREDNQAGRFLTYLVAAMHEADPALGGEAAQLLAGLQPAPPEAVLISLINDLEAAGGEFALALDDYQEVRSPAVQSAVAFLLEHCPKTFHLLIASRSDPALPIARMRARGQVVELRSADLRFSAAEATQFLNDVMGLRLDEVSVAALEERTEGWAAGLQMAALSMRDREDVRGFIAGFSGTDRHILDYLLDEVLASQPAEMRRFLLRTSILERLNGPLCDALFDEDERAGSSAAVLEALERENLFVVALDRERAWFRYHHLFADLLRAQLSLEQPDLVPSLHVRASAWLEENGLIPEAIRHRFAAGEMERAADLIERYGPVRWMESDYAVVGMADELPRDLLVRRPKLGLTLVWLQINQGFVEKAVPLLKDLLRQQSGSGQAPRAGEGWVQTVLGLVLAFLSPPGAPGLDPLPTDQTMDEIPADELILRDAADILYGMTLMRRGELDRAAVFSAKCIQRERKPYKDLTIPMLAALLASIYVFQGRLHAAADLCRDFLASIREQNLRMSAAGNLEVVLGDVLYEWDCLEESERHLLAALEDNRAWMNIMTDALGLLTLTLVLQAKGDTRAALEVVERFETRLRGDNRPQEFQEPFRTLRARMQLAGGDLESALRWAERIQRSEDFHLHPQDYELTLARICLAQGRFDQAESFLQEILPGPGSWTVRQIEVNLLLACTLAGQQRWPKAFAALETCLALAEPEGYLRTVLDAGEPARELLSAYLRSPDPRYARYAHKLLEAFPQPVSAVSPGPQPSGLVEALTARELEVLQLIATGKTNLEIAGQLYLSVGTVKAYTASIYRKLDVANRTEAVAYARQLGILS